MAGNVRELENDKAMVILARTAIRRERDDAIADEHDSRRPITGA